MALYFTGVSETNGCSQSFFLPTHTRGAINIILSSSWPSSSSSFSSSGYQFSPVACAIYLPLLRARAHRHTHTGTHAHAHLETVKVSTCTGREGATSPPLSLSLGITAELSCRGSRGREKTELQLPISETQADRPAD